MRSFSLLGIVLIVAAAAAQDINSHKRFGIEQDLIKHPQQTPQQALQSIAKLLNEGKIDYLAAHLIDPVFVDAKVKEYTKLYVGPEKAVELVAFNHLAQEIGQHFRKDPTIKEELRRFAKEAREEHWEIDPAKKLASVRLPNLTSRQVYFVEAKGRWYIQNPR